MDHQERTRQIAAHARALLDTKAWTEYYRPQLTKRIEDLTVLLVESSGTEQVESQRAQIRLLRELIDMPERDQTKDSDELREPPTYRPPPPR